LSPCAAPADRQPTATPRSDPKSHFERLGDRRVFVKVVRKGDNDRLVRLLRLWRAGWGATSATGSPIRVRRSSSCPGVAPLAATRRAYKAVLKMLANPSGRR